MNRLIKEIREINAEIGDYFEKLMNDIRRGKRLFLESIWFIEKLKDKEIVKKTTRKMEKGYIIETIVKYNEAITKTYKIPDLTDVFVIKRQKYTKIITKTQDYIGATLWEIEKNGKLLLQLRFDPKPTKTLLWLPPIKKKAHRGILFADVYNSLENYYWLSGYTHETNISLMEV